MSPRLYITFILAVGFTCMLALTACDLLPTPTPVATPTPTPAPVATITLAPPTPTVEASSTPSPPTATALPPEPSPTTSSTAELSPTRTFTTPSATPAPTHTPVTRTATSTTARSVPSTVTITPRPSTQAKLQTLANGFGSPDDLAVTAAGDILFGDFTNNALNILRAGAKKPVPLSTGFNEPEGIVVARDGAIIVAEQGTNRIIEVDPRTGAKKMLRQLKNDTSKDGVDGLGLDPATGDILVPDSPNGTLLRLSRDGSVQTIASGFVRPTGAAVEPGGSILVADEFGNVLYRLSGNGKRTVLARMYQPDDVVVGPDGSIYVNSLGGNIYRVDPANGRLDVLASGLKLPHGLAVAPDGNLIIAEAGRNRILRLVVKP